MSTDQLIVYVLTALAAVVVVLTRLRLGRDSGAGRVYVGRTLLTVHTAAGALALLTWLVFLLGGDSFSDGTAGIVGIAALALWWVVAVAGLLVLVRWLPTRGRHAASGTEDTWSEGDIPDDVP